MTEGKSPRALLSRFRAFIEGFGKPKDDLVLRHKAAASSGEDSNITVSNEMQADKLARISNNRLTPLTEKNEPSKDQWQKLKQSAKASDPGESNIDHWNQKQGGILSGTTFDAATTDISNGAKPRKRPSVVTQARITSNRLQALQAQMEKPANDIDRQEESA
jgi:hypothetical protein